MGARGGAGRCQECLWAETSPKPLWDSCGVCDPTRVVCGVGAAARGWGQLPGWGSCPPPKLFCATGPERTRRLRDQRPARGRPGRVRGGKAAPGPRRSAGAGGWARAPPPRHGRTGTAAGKGSCPHTCPCGATSPPRRCATPDVTQPAGARGGREARAGHSSHATQRGVALSPASASCVTGQGQQKPRGLPGPSPTPLAAARGAQEGPVEEGLAP